MRILHLILLLTPLTAFAAGSEDPEPPTPSETTTVCAEGLIWDIATQSCMTPEQSTNDDSARLDDARELAYAGAYDTAIVVLDSMQDSGTPMALTYYGFAHRKAGRVDTGMAYYTQAIAADPNNHLARSYMGQGLVAAGQPGLARQQLAEIRERGGSGTWAETSLSKAITTGQGYNY